MIALRHYTLTPLFRHQFSIFVLSWTTFLLKKKTEQISCNVVGQSAANKVSI